MITQKHLGAFKKIILKSKAALPHFKDGATKECMSEFMTGRRYKSIHDNVGRPDNRIMVFAAFVPALYVEKRQQYDLFYQVFENLEEVNQAFELVPLS